VSGTALRAETCGTASPRSCSARGDRRWLRRGGEAHEEGTVVHPHDGLVKYAFSKHEHAVGLLESMLDPAVAALVDWGSLALEKDSFVDRELRGRYADLLFSAPMGAERIYLYVLVEHQRKVEPLMIFRLEAYRMRIWERLVREEPLRTKLPLVVPVLIHHSETGWTAPTAFQDIVEVVPSVRPTLMPYIPQFEMRLVDLSPERASGLVEQTLTAFGKVVLWALSVAGDDARFLREIDRMQEAINRAGAAPDARDALFALLRYLSSTHARLGARRIAKLLTTRADQRTERVIMDGLEEFRQEGREEGMREGRARTLLEQLTVRFGPVPAEAKARIMTASEPTLARWAIRVLTAPTLEAVFSRSTSKKAKKTTPPRRPTRKTARAARA
jgi:predicted transposase YdaD